MVFLMYHELSAASRALCQGDPGYARYVVRAADFQAQLALLAEHGFQGLSVSDALSGLGPARGDGLRPPAGERSDAPHRAVAITFDDGCETDLLLAGPLLKDRAFGATFFLVTGHLGRRGYLTPAQTRELAGMGFEIGCHSMSHADLSRLEPAALRAEILGAKDKLEQIVGRRVDHFSCPGGRWSRGVARMAHQAGYGSVSTSRIGVNTPGSDRYRLNRLAVLRGSSRFIESCQGHGLRALRLRQIARETLRSAIGESVYGRIRRGLLR